MTNPNGPQRPQIPSFPSPRPVPEVPQRPEPPNFPAGMPRPGELPGQRPVNELGIVTKQQPERF